MSSGWFQRPYPYHLDYYRMLYGGSYAPYFGNLYGPPNNFFFGTPFFGNFSSNFGSNGFPAGGYPGDFGNGASGFGNGGPDCGGPAGYPNGPWSGGYVQPSSPHMDGDAAEPPALFRSRPRPA